MAKYLLGIDNGLTNSKCVLFDLKGKELAVAARSFAVSHPKPDWVEASPETQWNNTVECIKEVLAKSKIDPKEIGAIGITGFGNGVYCIDAEGKSTYPAIGSNDNRAVEIAQRLSRSDVADKIYAINNTPVFSFQPAVIARWLKENEPEAFAKTAWFCQCKDYLNFKLTGVKSAERNDVSGAAYLDFNTKEYSRELFELIGVPEMFDRVAPLAEHSRSTVGHVSQETAAETGLAAGTPVGAGMMDIAACCIGTGVVDARYAVCIVGTWGINEIVCDQKFSNMTSTQCFDTGEILTLSGGATSAGNLEWFMNQFGAALDVEAKERGMSRYDLATEKAAAIEPGGTSVLFLPYISTPNVHPVGRASFSNIAAGHTLNDIIHALFEGITFEHKRNFDYLKNAGAPVSAIRLAGGGAKNPYWSQMFADILNVPIEVIMASELGALGVSLSAAVGAGVFKDYDEAIKSAIEIKKIYYPIPENSEKYLRRYDSWIAMVEGMMPIWDSERIGL